MMPAVEATLRSHPARPTHPDTMSRCIEACFTCAGTCTACADACLSERDVEGLLACIRHNLDCAAICLATGSVVARSKAGASRQVLESQLSVCSAACRACAEECRRAWRDEPALPGVRSNLRRVRRGLHRDAGCPARGGIAIPRVLIDGAEDRSALRIEHLDAHPVAERQERRPGRAEPDRLDRVQLRDAGIGDAVFGDRPTATAIRIAIGDRASLALLDDARALRSSIKSSGYMRAADR
jgi:hypothetical protein